MNLEAIELPMDSYIVLSMKQLTRAYIWASPSEQEKTNSESEVQRGLY